MDTKKISFGFSKIVKKPSLLPTNKGKEKEAHKIELIKCLEGQEIKLVEESPVETPLIIPLKENTKTSAALASLLKRRAVLLGEADEPEEGVGSVEPGTNICNNEVVINESLEARAARELLASVQESGNESVDRNFVVPAKSADELPLEGAKQSSIDDYESVPIEQFGKAMLRGMGWVEPSQKKSQPPADDLPFVRPKGMGLGADKALKKQPLLIAPEKNEVLEIKKLAYVRILGGKHKDMYGQIEGFDDYGARVIVKLAIGGAKEAFNEFLCQPVSKKEFAQYGKCINTAKYEEYKKMENEHGQIIIKKEDDVKIKKEYDLKKEFKTGKESIRKSEKNDRDRSTRTQPSSYEKDGHRSDHHAQSRRQEGDQRSNSSRSERRYELEERSSTSSRRDYHDRRRNDHQNSKRSSRRQQYTDGSDSSNTESDSDSAYERKHKKKSNHKLKAKKKSSKKSKRKHHRTDNSSNSDSEDSEESYEQRKRKHKKKTKKSKKQRSRSRSKDRNDKR